MSATDYVRELEILRQHARLKRDLVEHVQHDHVGPDGRVRRLAMNTTDLRRWRYEELERAHGELHGIPAYQPPAEDFA